MGFDRSKFVANSSSESMHLDEFTCGICMDILVRPVFSPCCRHSYCTDCIGEWLKVNNTCPNDRAQLRDADLIEQSRAFLNLLDNLLVKCDYSHAGCDTSVRWCELAPHAKHCPYNPDNQCPDCCHPIRDKQHNCLDNLKQKCRLLEQEVQRLQTLSVQSSIDATPSALNTQPLAGKSMTNQKVVINSCELDPNIKERVVEIARRLSGICGSQRELAVQIKQELDKYYETDWTCMIREPGRAAIAFYCERGSFINFDLGDNNWIVFKNKEWK